MITKLATRRPFLDSALTKRETLQYPQSGAVLFGEGDQPRGIYIVHSGTIELLFRARNGELKRVSTGSAGELLGLDAVVSCRIHEYTARAVTPGVLGFIDRESFFKMLVESPDLWFSILGLMSQDVKASYDTLRTAAVAHV